MVIQTRESGAVKYLIQDRLKVGGNRIFWWHWIMAVDLLNLKYL